MPYASKAQQGLFHSPNSPVGKGTVAKFDEESKGEKNLPLYAGKTPYPKLSGYLASKKAPK